MMEAVGCPTKQVRHLGRVGREVGASLQLDRGLARVEVVGCAMVEEGTGDRGRCRGP